MIDTVQLIMFIRGIDYNFNFTAFCSMKTTTKSFNIFKTLKSTLDRFDIKSNNLSRILTDGTPIMVGKNGGFTPLIKKETRTSDTLVLTTDAITLFYTPRKSIEPKRISKLFK